MKLKEIREAKGISQRKAALDLNLSPVVYNRYENGLREPSNAMMLLLADYFGVSVDEILGRDDQLTPEQREDEIWQIREQLRRNPEIRTLFRLSKNATPDQLRAAAAVLKSFQPEEPDVD